MSINELGASLVSQMVKNLHANAGDPDSIPGLRRSTGEGNSNPVQYSCLENSKERGAWQALVHGVTKSQTRLKQVSTHAGTILLGQCFSFAEVKAFS